MSQIKEPVLCPECQNETRVRAVPMMYSIFRGFQTGVAISKDDEIYCPECGYVLDDKEIKKQQSEFHKRMEQHGH